MSDTEVILRSIDAKLGQILAALKKSEGPTVATARDLDGKYGNPTVKFDPRDWSGQSPAAVATTTHANSSPSTGAVHRRVVTRVGRDRRRASSTTSASIGT